jgi:predicted PurR-regulated permease PerM
MPKILNFGVAVGSGVVTAITALISTIYMLAGKGRLVPQLKKLTYAIAPRTSAERFLSVCSERTGFRGLYQR